MSDLRGRLRRLVRRGPRDVLYAHAATNGGNHLYLWMLAHTLRRANPQTYVQVVPSQAPWVAEFPALAELCLPGRMHVTDRRIARLGAGFDSDFTRSDLTDFTRARLLSSPSFTDRLAAAREVVTPGTLTVNVRRGDYYGTVHEAEFGIRIVPYVAAALALQAARAPLGHVQVVSDDLPWCQANLARGRGHLGLLHPSRHGHVRRHRRPGRLAAPGPGQLHLLLLGRLPGHGPGHRPRRRRRPLLPPACLRAAGALVPRPRLELRTRRPGRLAAPGARARGRREVGTQGR